MAFLREKQFVFLLITITAAAFFEAFSVPFMWDDFPFILQNELVRNFSHAGTYFHEDIARLYRPLRQVLISLCYQAFGENAAGFHLIGLLLHIGVVLTLFAILNRLFGERRLNFFAALLFALHPVHAERVLLITGSFDILGDLLTLLAFYWYLLSAKEEATEKRTYSLLLFFLALLSSENAFILIPLILVYEFVFENRVFWRKGAFLRYIPYCGVFAGYFLVRFLTIHTVAREGVTQDYFSLLFSMPQVFLQYLHIMLFPIHLSVYRSPNLPDPDFLFTNMVSCGIVLFLFFIAIRSKTPRELRFALLWFFVSLIPVSNIIPTGNIMEERYLYLPSFCLPLFVLYLVSRFGKRGKATYVLLAFLPLIYSVLLIHKSSFYLEEKTKWFKDVQTLRYLYPSDYEATLEKEAEKLDLNNPLKEGAEVRSIAQASVFFNAANMLRDERGCKSAEELYRLALVLNPMKIPAWHNLYGCFWMEGSIKGMTRGVEKLAYDRRTNSDIKVGLLMMLTSQLINEGDHSWRKHLPSLGALPLSGETRFEAFRNIGIGAFRERRFHEALFFFRKALEIRKDAVIEKHAAELEKALEKKKPVD